MTENSIQNPPIEQRNQPMEPLKAGAPASGGQPQSFPQGIDPLFLAYYYLMEASNITSLCAVIHSKLLQSNALSQQRLDNQAARMQWYHIPKLIEHEHHKRIAHTHWHGSFWNHGFHYTTYKNVTWKTSPNAGAVNDAEAKNQQINADRQILSDKLNVLQQLAQVGETNVSTLTDESMQSMQEGSNLLTILASLTFKALLTQQPN